MAYIGKTPITGNFVKLDAISVVNGQASYTMNNGGSAFTDYENVNQFLVSLNGILQSPTDSFTVSGSTLTFASNLSTGDVIDFVIVLGNTLDIGTPSDSTVTQAKTNFVSTSSSAGLQIKGDSTTAGTLQLNCEQNSHGIKLQSPPHSANQSYTLKFPSGNVTAGKVLKVDSVSGSGTTGIGTLTFGDAGGSNTPAFQGHLSSTQSISDATWTKVAIASEDFDTDSKLDSSSNYRFTPTEAGKYYFYGGITYDSSSTDDIINVATALYKNGSRIMRTSHYPVGKAYEISDGFSFIDTADSDDYYEMYAYFDITSNTPQLKYDSTSGSSGFTFFGGYKIIT